MPTWTRHGPPTENLPAEQAVLVTQGARIEGEGWTLEGGRSLRPTWVLSGFPREADMAPQSYREMTDAATRVRIHHPGRSEPLYGLLAFYGVSTSADPSVQRVYRIEIPEHRVAEAVGGLVSLVYQPYDVAYVSETSSAGEQRTSTMTLVSWALWMSDTPIEPGAPTALLGGGLPVPRASPEAQAWARADSLRDAGVACLGRRGSCEPMWAMLDAALAEEPGGDAWAAAEGSSEIAAVMRAGCRPSRPSLCAFTQSVPRRPPPPVPAGEPAPPFGVRLVAASTPVLVVVSDVFTGSRGEASGLARGDVLVAIGDAPVADVDLATASLGTVAAGTPIVVEREGSRVSLPAAP